MAFADGYLEKHAFTAPLISVPPHPDVDLIIVIPSLDEPAVCESVLSLLPVEPLSFAVEILIILNSSESAHSEVLQRHHQTYNELIQLNEQIANASLKIIPVLVDKLPSKHAGVGLARKIGMDEAVRRFNVLNRPSGIISAFDADALVDPGYLFEIHQFYRKQPDTRAAVHYFEHPLRGDAFPEPTYQYMAEYELDLRYFLHAVRFTGYPTSYHTVGSSFSVRASEYCKVGGMNKRKAGEDFYFLQKIFADGHIGEINSICVRPSPRVSDRVPFGTGRAMGQMMAGQVWNAYHPQAFIDLREFFGQLVDFYQHDNQELINRHAAFPDALKSFLPSQEFVENIHLIKQNTASLEGFVKRFFHWFNHFKIIRFVNESHPEKYAYLSVFEASVQLMKMNGMHENPDSILTALQFYRAIDRQVHPQYLSFCRDALSGKNFDRL